MSTGANTRAARHRASTPNRKPLFAALAAAAAVVVILAWPGASGAALQVDTSDPRGVAVAMRTGCQAWLSAHPTGSSAQRTRMQQCVTDEIAIIAALDAAPTPSPSSSPTSSASPTPSASSSPTPSPTVSSPSTSPTVQPTTPSPTATTPAPSLTPTPTPTATGTPGGDCPAFPATPDASCTGAAHTGQTLLPCDPNTFTANSTHRGCLITGTWTVRVANIRIEASVIRGRLEGVVGGANSASLLGLTLVDVEIDGTAQAADGQALIGNNDFTLLRVNGHGSSRGIGVGNHVTAIDSYLHGWNPPTGAHVTAAGSNGGGDNVFTHNTLSCDILNDGSGAGQDFACSAGFSIYGDDTGGNHRYTIMYNRFESGSSYCVQVRGAPARQPFGDIDFEHNLFGRYGADLYGKPADSCSEFGPVATEPGSWGVNGNVWADNHTLSGTLVTLS